MLETRRGRQRAGIILRPQPFHSVAECGNAALGRHVGIGEPTTDRASRSALTKDFGINPGIARPEAERFPGIGASTGRFFGDHYGVGAGGIQGLWAAQIHRAGCYEHRCGLRSIPLERIGQAGDSDRQGNRGNPFPLTAGTVQRLTPEQLACA
jgi:hypothetical protein